ncbi:hypothetical protein M9H77_27281 [Catharanthus roseus]|uniref:Uncharacterized protein n=1 Tax=Catharanthus roseus TaxID=4058 RepID=A0ACC0AET6_CATRO|nr:hypothetical protein M9H77_27281 [Catharanthus roseus]
MSLVTEEIRAIAEIVQGKELCQATSYMFLKEMGIPRGLLPLEDMEECGRVKETGFIWLKQKKKIDHKFEKIGKFAQYANEVTAFIEPKKLRQVTGVKAKEFFMWITVNEVSVDDQTMPFGKVIFKTPTGISRAFPISAFEVPPPEAEIDGGCQEI